MQINMADPQGHKYYVQIDDGEKILVDDTTNEQTIKSTIKLKEVNSIVQLRVYDEDGFLITINNILIKRDMLDAALGAIRVNDNDAVKTTLDSGKINMRHTHIQKQKIQLLKLIYMLLIKMPQLR